MTVRLMGVAMLRANSNVGSKDQTMSLAAGACEDGLHCLVPVVAGGAVDPCPDNVATGVVCSSAGLQCGYDISVTHCDKSVTSLATSCFCTSGVWKRPADEVLTCVAAAAEVGGLLGSLTAASRPQPCGLRAARGKRVAARTSTPDAKAPDSTTRRTSRARCSGFPRIRYSIKESLSFARPTSSCRLRDTIRVKGITLRLRETLPENHVFRSGPARSRHHPAAYEVWTSDAESTWDGAYDVPFRMFTSRDARVPVVATDRSGHDVLAALSALDAHPASVGLDELVEYTLDFGPIEHPEYAKLLIDSWAIDATAGKPLVVDPHVDAEDRDGRWVTIRKFGPPRGDRKTVVVDLSKRLPKGARRLRVALGMRGPSMRWVVDRIRLDESKPAPVTLTVLDPVSATLGYRGRATTHPSTFRNPLEALDDEVSDDPNALGYGAFTRYGDVRDLLTHADDMFVVMRHGDQITVTYPGSTPPPIGWTRDIMLRGHAYYKNIIPGAVPDPKTPVFDRGTEPLPFLGMKDYPVDFPAAYPDDAAHRTYRAEFNTRLFPRP